MKINKDNLRCFKFFGKFAWQTDKKYFGLLIANIIVNSISPFIDILGTQYLIDEIAKLKQASIINVIFWIGFICVGGFAASNLKKIISENINRCCERFDRILKTNLSLCCTEMKFQYTEDTDMLDIIKNAERALNETGQVNGLITSLSNLVSNFFVALGVVTLICTRIPLLMIPVVLSFTTKSFVTSKVNKGRRKFFDEMSNVERGSSYFNTELQDGRYAKDIRLYDCSQIFIDKYDEYVDKIYNTGKKWHLSFIRYWNVDTIFYFLCEGSTYVLLTVNVFNKIITIGEFSSLFQATEKFGGAIRSIVNSYLEINYTSSVLKYYIDFVEGVNNNNDILGRTMNSGKIILPDRGIIEANEDLNKLFGTKTNNKNEFVQKTDKACEVEFRNVSFKYPNTEKYILNNISVKIKSGEHLSIVGQNGAGKTTFIKLLCRLYDNYEGEILIDGKEIREYNFYEYMNKLSVVFQDFRLFAFTVKENVTIFDDKNIDLNDIYKVSGVENWINSLSDKDSTYIYKMFVENGIEPSGGESQKLAIARALYKNSPIVVLDEPTAALDPLSEYEVYMNFDKLVKNKTAVYISHRLSSCRFCDRIIVFNDGKLIEDGTHDELYNMENGFYANMYKTQAKQYNLS